MAGVGTGGNVSLETVISKLVFSLEAVITEEIRQAQLKLF